jgi:hypothetical protein
MSTATPVDKLIVTPPGAAADGRSLSRRDLLFALALLWAMVLTRADQGSPHALPDASVAVFFLLGLFTRSALWLPIAMVLAAAVDACVVTGDVSAYCTTPASLFLIPTYGTMWLAGGLARSVRHSAAVLAVASIAAVVAFLISSGSFYFLSGQFPDLPLVEYSRQVLIRYLPPYVSHCLLYVAAAVAVSKAAPRLRRAQATRRREPAGRA